MATGDSNDIVTRVKRLIPNRWFSYVAPIRDALLGGLSDSTAWCYAWWAYAKTQSRIATSTGIFLDLISYDFLGRYLSRSGLSDLLFRKLILATILQERVTRKGLSGALTTLLNIPPVIIEPWNTGDCGAWGAWTFAYGTAGCWGSIQLPGQSFVKVSRAGLAPSGVPSVNGYGGWLAGYSNTTAHTYGGAMQYVGSSVQQIGVIDQTIYNLITLTKPSGGTAWTQIN